MRETSIAERLYKTEKPRPHQHPSLDGNFSWQSNDALFKIRRYYGEAHITPSMCYTLALYQVLTERASKFNAEEFAMSKSDLARESGMSTKQVALCLNILVDVQLIGWKQNYAKFGDRDANTYKLLSVKPANPSAVPKAIPVPEVLVREVKACEN